MSTMNSTNKAITKSNRQNADVKEVDDEINRQAVIAGARINNATGNLVNANNSGDKAASVTNLAITNNVA